MPRSVDLREMAPRLRGHPAGHRQVLGLEHVRSARRSEHARVHHAGRRGVTSDAGKEGLRRPLLQLRLAEHWRGLVLGRNDRGQLGRVPLPLESAPAAVIGLPLRATDLAVGEAHACALLEDDSVHCWGANSHAQLGDATQTDSAVPVRVRTDHVFTVAPKYSGPVTGIFAISAGARFTCVLDGRPDHTNVACWGQQDRNQCGIGAVDMQLYPMRQDAASVPAPPASVLACGHDHACAVNASKGVYCWGGNIFDQCGAAGSRIGGWPMELTGVPTAVAAGDRHSCAHTTTGLWCWGDNDHGQLGRSGAGSKLPSHVSGTAGFDPTTVTQLSAGSQFTCALADQRVWCWGALAGASPTHVAYLVQGL